ncbi:hypothetical protein SAMN04488128_103215 [Chitinophaga eiseniae]|uniref:Uncharacterized protein n=1 Tax=Chitinophaga eiseniae TaxID=634771 RepID=A0A1T4SQA3_9BACT|nr:hypothetical protein [Chitinophaga eiseniae]SKA30068.1 hypothetical protein SAMN04488128_103215 [Chitinophaga eiseniae]
MYYNTTNLTGDALRHEHDNTVTQEKTVMDFFNKHPAGKYLATDVYHHLVTTGKISVRVPLISIRRAITNLKKDGRLQKLEEKAVGAYGYNKTEHYYQLSVSWGKTTGAGYAEIHPVQPELF